MSKTKSIEEIQAGWNAYDRPANGARYRHYKGGLYEIVVTGFLEENLTPVVVYRSMEHNTIWVRSAEVFLEIVEHDGTSSPRFSRVVE